MIMRDVYIYKNGQIFKEGKKKPLKFRRLEGWHNNYQITLHNKLQVFLKQSIGASDYADVISKRLCDELHIKCADCELVIMRDFPQENEEQKMGFDEYVEFCKSHFNITDIDKLEESYRDYLLKFEGIETKHALLSYDYKYQEPYKSARIIKLDELVNAYSEITGQDGTIAIETYVKIAQELSDPKSKVGKALRKKLKLKNNIELSQFFDLDLKKIAMLGYATCQMDMNSYNLHLALIKTKKGCRLEVAPLFDNGESFNLSEIKDATIEDVDEINSDVFHYGNALILKETDTMDAEDQVVSLAEEIISNPELAKFYAVLEWTDIEELCKKENIGEDDFDVVKHSVVSVFNERMSSLKREIQRLQQIEDMPETDQEFSTTIQATQAQEVEKDEELASEEDELQL